MNDHVFYGRGGVVSILLGLLAFVGLKYGWKTAFFVLLLLVVLFGVLRFGFNVMGVDLQSIRMGTRFLLNVFTVVFVVFLIYIAFFSNAHPK